MLASASASVGVDVDGFPMAAIVDVDVDIDCVEIDGSGVDFDVDWGVDINFDVDIDAVCIDVDMSGVDVEVRFDTSSSTSSRVGIDVDAFSLFNCPFGLEMLDGVLVFRPILVMREVRCAPLSRSISASKSIPEGDRNRRRFFDVEKSGGYVDVDFYCRLRLPGGRFFDPPAVKK